MSDCDEFDFPVASYHWDWSRFSEYFDNLTELWQLILCVDFEHRLGNFCNYFFAKLFELFFGALPQITKLRKVARLVANCKKIVTE